MTNKSLQINDTGLVNWLWENAEIVTEINKILKQKKSKDQTLAKIKQLLSERSNTTNKETE